MIVQFPPSKERLVSRLSRAATNRETNLALSPRISRLVSLMTRLEQVRPNALETLRACLEAELDVADNT